MLALIMCKDGNRYGKNQSTRASYRCRLDPDSGKFTPLPVWSQDALKDDIIEDQACGSLGPGG